MPLPLFFAWAIYILLGLTGGVLAGKAAYRIITRKDKIVFLSGEKGVGKTTLLEVLRLKDNEMLKESESKGTPSNKENALEVKIANLKYGFTDTEGAAYNKKKIEDLKNKLAKKYKNKVLEIYVFDASDYSEKYKAIIEAFKIEADKRGFKCVALGTHKDKIDEQKEQSIKQELKDIMYCQIFQLTNNSQAKSEVEDFIKGVS